MRYTDSALVLAALLITCETGLAQAPATVDLPGDDDTPRVESLTFEGVHGVEPSELEDGVVTQPTRCRGPLLRPLCAISRSSLFWAQHDLDLAELERDEIRVRVIYFRRGYRRARVESIVEPDGNGVDVRFRIDEGPVTNIAALTVEQTDTVLTERQIRQARIPGEGQPLDLVRLDTARITLKARLWDQGYGDAVIRDSAAIDTTTHLADLRIHIDPKPRTTIGQVVVEGNELVSERTILRLFDLQPGQPYRRTDMTAAQRRLYETELFRQSLVRVPETEDSAKTVVITVREAPPRAVRVGPGFNMVEFLQGEARYTRYNWMGGARRLETRVAIGNILAPQLYGRSFLGSRATPGGVGTEVDHAFLTPTWQAGIDLNQPFFLSTRQSLGLGISMHRRSIPGIVIDRGVSATASLTRRLGDRMPLSLTYRYEQTHVEAGEVYFCVNFGVCDLPTIGSLGASHRFSPLGLSLLVERADDALTPSSGYMARVDLEHASSVTLSDFRHHRIAAETSRYVRFGNAVLAGRLRGGWVRALESTSSVFELPETSQDVLHPRRRLFAGGARSVRGYGENQLGPRVLTIPPQALLDPKKAACTAESIAAGTCDPNGVSSGEFQARPLGGNTLLEASIEYRLPVRPNLTAAVFVDAGIVRGARLNFPPGDRTAITPGIGVRYISPVGPVRVDLGFRPSIVEDLPVVTQIEGEDGEFRLVQLGTLKRYNPLERSGGFLTPFFRRLQLHLAIGEAF